MKLRNESYEVTISIDPTYTVGSADNVNYYEHVLVASPIENGDYYTTFGITVISGEREVTIALVGGDTCDDSKCAVLAGDVLTVLQNDIITGIDLAKCCIINSKKNPHSHVNYALFKVPDGLECVFKSINPSEKRRNMQIWRKTKRETGSRCRISLMR